MRSKLLLAVLCLTFASLADAQSRRWFVQTSDDKIISFTDDDGAPTPTGTTAVADSVIRAADPPGATGEITPLGTWDGTTYTAPSGGGINPPAYDPATDSGQVKDAANDMMDVFDAALAFIQENRAVWRPAAVAKAVTGIHWQIVNSARIALNSTRTHARRQKFLEESASWPTGTNGNATDYVDVFNGNDGIGTPTKDFSWVNPEMDPFTRVTVAMAATAFQSATNVENAPPTADLLGRAWINDIP